MRAGTSPGGTAKARRGGHEGAEEGELGDRVSGCGTGMVGGAAIGPGGCSGAWVSS